jgi:hypothetical protein
VEKAVTVRVNDSKKSLWIEAYFNHVIIKVKHTNIVSIQKNGQPFLNLDQVSKTGMLHNIIFCE